MKSFLELVEEHTEWTKKTFPEATAFSSLQKLKEEVREIEQDLEAGNAIDQEYADALMCIFDSASRAGISIWDIWEAFEMKLEINKRRKWVKNKDNTYSHVNHHNHE